MNSIFRLNFGACLLPRETMIKNKYVVGNKPYWYELSETEGVDVDVPFDCMTGIYYVNSNDGYTEFKDGTKVESVANRVVAFPCTVPHAGTTCTDASVRTVINFNFHGNLRC